MKISNKNGVLLEGYKHLTSEQYKQFHNQDLLLAIQQDTTQPNQLI